MNLGEINTVSELVFRGYIDPPNLGRITGRSNFVNSTINTNVKKLRDNSKDGGKKEPMLSSINDAGMADFLHQMAVVNGGNVEIRYIEGIDNIPEV